MTKLDFLEKRALLCALCLGLGLMGACGDDSGDDGPAAGTGGSSAGRGGTGGTGGSSAGTGGSSAGRGGTGGSSAGRGGTGGSSAGTGGGGTGGVGGSSDAGVEPDSGVADAGDIIVPDEPDAGEAALVTYTDDVQPVLVQFCGGCHTAPTMASGHSATSDYDDAVRVADEIVAEIQSGGMPQGTCNGGEPGDAGCVSVEGLALIEQWIEDGTPE